MATTIVTKNSSTAAAVPTAAQLVQGELAVNVADKRLYTEDSVGGIVELGTNPSAEIVANGGIALPDNGKATFGAGDDLQIYHDGSHSYVKDAGAGNLKLQGASYVLMESDEGKIMLRGQKNNALQAYYDGAVKLSTTATGIDVTGTATMDGLTVAGTTDATEELARFGNNAGTQELIIGQEGSTGYAIKSSVDLRLHADYENDTSDGGSNIEMYTDGTQRMSITGSTGDISFYEDTGTTAKFYWDASAESLGIGTTTTTGTLNIQAGNPTIRFYDSNLVTRQMEISAQNGNAIIKIDPNQTEGNSYYSVQIDAEERMRIDSAGNVGIGSGNPQNKLDIEQSAAVSARLLATGATSSSLKLEVKGGATQLTTTEILANSGGALTFATGTTAGAERMRIDSAGNVGIGGTTTTGWANKQLVLDAGASASAAFVMVNDTTGRAATDGSVITLSGSDMYFIQRESANMIFRTANTERMRIDSAGNLLVGKTSPAISSTGVELRPNGQLFATQSANYSLLLNRTTSDGDIVQFRKDGTTVGSIGAQSGRLTVGSNSAAGVRFDGTQLVPMNGASISDNTITLGDSGFRFKDLYLSGGVYLGGTGAANKLDDYEEGTWTPVLAGIGSGTINQQYGRYTKVGNLVHVTGKLGWTGATGTAGVSISGLPFAAGESSDSNQRNSAYPAGDWQNIDYLMNNNGQFRTDGSSLTGVVDNGNGSAILMACTTHIGSSGEFNFNVTYRA